MQVRPELRDGRSLVGQCRFQVPQRQAKAVLGLLTEGDDLAHGDCSIVIQV
jgi:hypothetical protein